MALYSLKLKFLQFSKLSSIYFVINNLPINMTRYIYLPIDNRDNRSIKILPIISKYKNRKLLEDLKAKFISIRGSVSIGENDLVQTRQGQQYCGSIILAARRGGITEEDNHLSG